MFSGIVQEVGTLKSLRNGTIAIRSLKVLKQLEVGDSVAVNGVCLTVTDVDNDTFRADLMGQTLRLTTLGTLKVSAPLNLEPSLRYGDKIGGHPVSGHVEGVGKVVGLNKDENALLVKVDAPTHIIKSVCKQGSITVDGVSLTVCDVQKSEFEVSLTPYTLKATVASTYALGTPVNLESDKSKQTYGK